ncbi:iron-containing alcohol dehydrogenase [Marinobacter sp. OP 3.4]|uniref:iron-containing alcohol dehydrogenase n=1 Tax=Marinobacter sp. OP 3.4 TaxID=3076501 RepID=UPI002E1D8571
MTGGLYNYISQDRVIWGTPAGTAILEEAARRNSKRLFIIASRTLNRKTSVISDIKTALGDKLVGLFDECQEHAPRDTIIAAANAVRASNPDLIVSIGGGTVIDTAKVVLVALAENVTTTDGLDDLHLSINPDGSRRTPAISSPPVRQIAIPTTLSGAEYSCLGGSSDPKRKIKDGFYGSEICPASVIIDPAVTLPTPEWLWLSTGIRAIDHAIESICSPGAVPLVDACALHALSLLSEALGSYRNNPDDLVARQKALQGTWLASQGILRVDYGASHGIGHSLGAVTQLSHGYTSCVLLPAVLRWNREDPQNDSRQRLIAERMGRGDGDAAQAVEDLISSLGLPTRLRAVNVSKNDFAQVAEGAMGNIWVNTNPRPITSEEDVMEILQQAY